MDNLKITWVNVDDACCDEDGTGFKVFVDFDNGAGISFLLDAKTDDPLMDAVKLGMGGKCQAEAGGIRWRNGASLSIDEMMMLVVKKKTEPTIEKQLIKQGSWML